MLFSSGDTGGLVIGASQDCFLFFIKDWILAAGNLLASEEMVGAWGTMKS